MSTSPAAASVAAVPPEQARRPAAAILAWGLVVVLLLAASASAAWLYLSLRDEQARAAGLQRSLSLSQRDLAGVRGDLERANATALDLNARLDSERQVEAGLRTELSRGLGSQPASGWFWQWGTTVRIPASGMVSQPVPDTFDMDVSFWATAPVSLEFTHLSGGGVYASYGPAISMTHVRFTGAEGCAGYTAVLTAEPGTLITANEWVRYNPAAYATGPCASISVN